MKNQSQISVRSPMKSRYSAVSSSFSAWAAAPACQAWREACPAGCGNEKPAVLILATLYFAGNRKVPTTAEAAEARGTAFPIRFRVDGKADVDWSGGIEPAPGRITGWQPGPKRQRGEGFG